MRTRHKLLSLGFLTLLPFVAHAERRLSYRCDGIKSAQGGVDIHAQTRIARFYTLYLENSGGRWFNWDEHRWYPIHSITEDAFQLAVDSDGGVFWTLSIDRADGTWNQMFAGGGGTTSTAGKMQRSKTTCTAVALSLAVPTHDQRSLGDHEADLHEWQGKGSV
jgi:hypothetical protein